jgi:hypothetical protein
MDGLILFFVVLAVMIGLGIVAIRYHQEKQRTEQMQAVAERLDFSFSPETAPDLLGELGHLDLFSKGRSRKIRNMLRREIHDIQVTLFDYRYTTGSGKHSHTHDQTVVLFETDRLRLPFFVLRPEGFFHKLAGAFGYQDIDFEAHPVFSEIYLLRGYDETGIRALFREEALCYYTRHENLCTEGDRQKLVFYRANRRVDPGWMEDFLEQGMDVLSLFLQMEGALDTLPLLGFTFEAAQGEQDELEAEWWEVAA